tara:strand:- start:292 stop:459 length:168 start_codon:yes stop_codon:yes gene_type:complete
MDRYLGKIRPQVFSAVIILGVLAGIGMRWDVPEIAAASVAGIIALAKDVIGLDGQ